MLDIQTSLAQPIVIRREDYATPDWLVPQVTLDFALAAATTCVRAAL